MFDVVFAIECGDVRSSQRAAALITQQTKAPEVVCLAQWILSFAFLVVGWEEFRSDNLPAILFIRYDG